MAQLSLELFHGLLHLNISSICGNSYVHDEDNHCAHFVSHVMGYHFGYTCKMHSGQSAGDGATIRVHELSAHCPQVGEWKDKPSGDCLAFITKAPTVNLVTKRMVNIP
ncbi:MAG: hypothetical protein C4308_05005 [Chitinophagaceae bacterium]